MLIGKDKDVNCDDHTDFFENRYQVLVRGRNLLMLLEASFLKKAVQGFGPWHRLFAMAVEKGENLNSVSVNLVLRVPFTLKLR